MIGYLVTALVVLAALVVLGVLSQICAYIAERKGHPVRWYAVLGFLLFPVGLLAALLASDRRYTPPSRSADDTGPFPFDDEYWTVAERVAFVERRGQAER